MELIIESVVKFLFAIEFGVHCIFIALNMWVSKANERVLNQFLFLIRKTNFQVQILRVINSCDFEFDIMILQWSFTLEVA